MIGKSVIKPISSVCGFVCSLAYEFDPAKNSPGLRPLLLTKVFLLSWDRRKWQPP